MSGDSGFLGRVRKGVIERAVSELSLSVVIPTLNEGENIEDTLAALLNRASSHIEIIVVDGGSSDNTVDIARRYADRVEHTKPSRGRQLSLGVDISSGDVILFLHADSFLPHGWDMILRGAFSRSDVVGGAFKLRISPSIPSLRLIASVANLRSRFLGIAYGDQGIFVREDILESIGGVKEIPLFEDVDLWHRMKKAGRTVILNDFIDVSHRRWRDKGALYTTLKNWSLHILYTAGIPPSTLYRIYYGRDLEG